MHGTRRDMLRAGALAGGGLLLTASTPLGAWGAALDGTSDAVAPAAQSLLTAWVRITPDNVVTLIVSQAEIGQGISTTLPALLADELGADWARVRLETAPVAEAYQNPRIRWMFTGNSESVSAFHQLMRTAGAAAREMLSTAAAMRWGLPASECSTRDGFVVHAKRGLRLPFGAVAAEAAKLPVPTAPQLRPITERRLEGRAVDRVDVPAKCDGTATFGIDYGLPGLLHAAVRTAPEIGGSYAGGDEQAARAISGVRRIVQVGGGVAVVADRYWQARRGLEALVPRFDAGVNRELSSDTIETALQRALDAGPFATPVDEGDAATHVELARAAGNRVHSADYLNPFLAHATMEPMNCTARVTADRCDVWAPTQGQELAQYALAATLDLPRERVFVNRTPYAGGGFGRRLLPDFVVQAALIARAAGAPVKTIWDREEDFARDYFRPATRVRLTAALGVNGMPEALTARVVSPTILLPVFPPIAKVLQEQKIDPSALEGLLELHYSVPRRRVDFHLFETAVPTSVLRTTGFGPNNFALESFVDELARSLKRDPYQYRRALLIEDPRGQAVLERAASMAGWGHPLAEGHGRGIAYAHAFGTRIALVLEVAVKNNVVHVRRAAAAVDCGRVLDPGISASNIEGGIIFGLAGCKAQITFRDGAAAQRNFGDYWITTLAESPQVRVEFIDGGGDLGGTGEVSPVVVPAALGNAIAAATGRRIRELPLSRVGLEFGPGGFA